MKKCVLDRKKNSFRQIIRDSRYTKHDYQDRAILPVMIPLWHPADPPLVLPPLPLPGQPPNDPPPYLQHSIQIYIMNLLIQTNHSKPF